MVNRKWVLGLWFAVVFGLYVWSAVAAPVTPDQFSEVTTERRTTDTSSKSVDAYAGNVSELVINHTQITLGWQGYFGNVTGEIVLDDANNDSMYTWDYPGGGEVFASRNSSINWTSGNVICGNITHIETEENEMNFNGGVIDDVDGINETFSEDTHPEFDVGAASFNADDCDFSVSTYVDDAADADRNFNETLLYSISDVGTIYMAFIVNGGADGFRNSDATSDFQMIVPEDGHGTDTSTTSYYFYVELV